MCKPLPALWLSSGLQQLSCHLNFSDLQDSAFEEHLLAFVSSLPASSHVSFAAFGLFCVLNFLFYVAGIGVV